MMEPGVVVLSGKDTVHQDHHRAFLCLRVEPVRKGFRHRQPALRAANGILPGAGEERSRQQEDGGQEDLDAHIHGYVCFVPEEEITNQR